jgi:hypothetical protein
MQPPNLCKVGDRAYTLAEPFNIGALREFLESIGFRHAAPKTGDLYAHRWTSPDRTSIVSLFPSGRLVVLGPAVAQLDELTIATPVGEGAGR